MAQPQEDFIQQSPPPPGGPAPITRRGRALIGWMTEDFALRMLSGGRGDIAPTDEQRQRAEAARAAVAAREPTAPEDGDDVALPAPPEVLGAFGANRLQEVTAAGFEVRMVDLERVRAFQTHVIEEQAIERLGDVDEDDREGLTNVTLPVAQPINPPIGYDETQKARVVLWPDLNLKIVGNVRQQVIDQAGNELPVVGFALGALPSLLRVTEFQGRYALTDGYHRAFGLLSRGVTRVPALFHHVENFEDMKVPPMMLPRRNGWGRGRLDSPTIWKTMWLRRSTFPYRSA
jgi:hypothetical protein